jgi:hypothetical protein
MKFGVGVATGAGATAGTVVGTNPYGSGRTKLIGSAFGDGVLFTSRCQINL